MQLRCTPGLQATVSHWGERPGWRAGRTKYAVHLTLEHAAPVRELTSRLAAVLSRFPALDVVPDQWLHVTLVGIGFTDQVSGAQLDAVAGAVADAWQHQPKPTLVADHLLIASESVRVVWEASDWLMGFVDAQRRAVERVVGARAWEPFTPHTSLAYANSPTPVAELAAALSPVADGLEVPPVPASATLLELRREQPLWHWRALRTIG